MMIFMEHVHWRSGTRSRRRQEKKIEGGSDENGALYHKIKNRHTIEKDIPMRRLNKNYKQFNC
jgi:hypothetical protein